MNFNYILFNIKYLNTFKKIFLYIVYEMSAL